MTKRAAEATMHLDPIRPGLWCLRTDLVQAYAVRHGEGFNLIDASTAGSEEAILSCLATIDRTAPDAVQLNDIVITHGHDDHSGAAAGLARRTGARILASATDAPVIEGRKVQPEPQLTDWEVPLYEQVVPSGPPAPPAHVDVLLDDGAVLEWDQPAVVVSTPGHTPGSVSLLFSRARTLIAGDAIASHDGEPMLGVFNCDPDQARESFRALAEMDVEVACFGHGEPLLHNAQERLAGVAARL
jgi:glyoxylase-like metal-dependent hydrolase (beta-lactamase superfamily II)